MEHILETGAKKTGLQFIRQRLANWKSDPKISSSLGKNNEARKARKWCTVTIKE